MKIIYITNQYGHRQAIDQDNDDNQCCPDCLRCHVNFGGGVSCDSCQTEEMEYAEQLQADFPLLFR